MGEQWIEVDGRRFRVVLRSPVRYRGEFVPCRGCRQLGKAMTVRHVERVFGADGGELLRDSPDGSLAANTFRREHEEAGPLCGRCRFFRMLKAIGAAVRDFFSSLVLGTREPGRQPSRK